MTPFQTTMAAAFADSFALQERLRTAFGQMFHEPCDNPQAKAAMLANVNQAFQDAQKLCGHLFVYKEQ